MENKIEAFLNYFNVVRFLIITACFVIIIAAMKAASFLVIIILLSLFITAICLPLLNWLKKKGVPETLAILMVIISLLVFAGLTGLVVGSSISNFIVKMPFYEEKAAEFWKSAQQTLIHYNIIDNDFKLMNQLNSGKLLSYSTTFFASFGNVFTALLLVFIIFIFMIFESRLFGEKIKFISPNSLEQTEHIIQNLQMYFGIKFLTSLATGACITIALLIIGVDFPVLWGFIAFVLNFIPSVGSFIAAIPAVLLAIIQISPAGGLVTVIVYFVINTLIGNVVEPQLMGKNLGISPVIVFISMIFWGYVLGPFGMLIATPLMIVIKIVFDNGPSTKNMGILIGDGKEIIQQAKKIDENEA